MYGSSFQELFVTKNMVLCGFMAALAVGLSMTTSIEVGPYIRIGFSGIPNRIVEFLFGPVTGCLFGGALDIMKYLKKEGRKAGMDYGIMGFDNIDVLDYVVPRLTTISNSVEEVAGAAVSLLFELINDKAAGRETKPPLFIRHRFIEGETI